MADFLHRYLGMFDSVLYDLDVRAAARNVLLDPYSTPEEALPWLAEFQGLVIDERWSLAARRQLVAQVATLFRTRGTILGLKTFLSTLLGLRRRDVIILEHFKLRGLGAAVLGSEGLVSSAVVGMGFRVGGALGEEREVAVLGTATTSDSAGRDPHAHKFTVILPAQLDGELLGAVRDVLDTHRPAHTELAGICTIETGMRIGVGLYTGLTSMVGLSGGFGQFQIDHSQLGGTDVLGRPGPGTRPESSRLGMDSRIG